MPPIKNSNALSQIPSTVLQKSSQALPRHPPSHHPIRILVQDPLSRFVVFDGSQAVSRGKKSEFQFWYTAVSQPFIEPHYSQGTGLDADYKALVEARWQEHLAEHYLRNSGVDLRRAGSRTLFNTPVQLYLAHSRLARAQLEISIYSKLLEQEIGQSLRNGALSNLYLFACYSFLSDFQRTMELSLPKDGLFHDLNNGRRTITT